jgi:hypothetical protein
MTGRPVAFSAEIVAWILANYVPSTSSRKLTGGKAIAKQFAKTFGVRISESALSSRFHRLARLQETIERPAPSLPKLRFMGEI